MSVDFNCHPNKGTFLKELKCFIDAFELVDPDMNILLSDTYKYISRNRNCRTSWSDHVLALTNNIVTNMSILYEHHLEDPIPVKFELMTPQEESYCENVITII